MKLLPGTLRGFIILGCCLLAALISISFLSSPGVQATVPLELEKAHIVSRTGQEGATTSDSKVIDEGEDASLYLVLEAKEKGKTVYFSEADRVIVDGKEIPSDSVRRWDKSVYGKLKIRWYKVEPKRNNLSNTRGGWHWVKVPHAETIFHSGDWRVKADVNPTIFKTRTGKGTMRFKVEARLGRDRVSSPGRESYDKTGISDKVHRISVRGTTGVDIVDWAYSFMNLPYIWGSETPTGRQEDHQSERYIGADCADYVVAAARRAGHPLKYGGSHNFSPNDSRKYTKYISRLPELHLDGYYYENDKKVKIGEGGVRPGDIVLFTRRHVGILARDFPPRGYLTSQDTILHAFFKEPAEEPISTAYHSDFSIVRLVK